MDTLRQGSNQRTGWAPGKFVSILVKDLAMQIGLAKDWRIFIVFNAHLIDSLCLLNNSFPRGTQRDVDQRCAFHFLQPMDGWFWCDIHWRLKHPSIQHHNSSMINHINVTNCFPHASAHQWTSGQPTFSLYFLQSCAWSCAWSCATFSQLMATLGRAFHGLKMKRVQVCEDHEIFEFWKKTIVNWTSVGELQVPLVLTWLLASLTWLVSSLLPLLFSMVFFIFFFVHSLPVQVQNLSAVGGRILQVQWDSPASSTHKNSPDTFTSSATQVQQLSQMCCDLHCGHSSLCFSMSKLTVQCFHCKCIEHHSQWENWKCATLKIATWCHHHQISMENSEKCRRAFVISKNWPWSPPNLKVTSWAKKFDVSHSMQTQKTLHVKSCCGWPWTWPHQWMEKCSFFASGDCLMHSSFCVSMVCFFVSILVSLLCCQTQLWC